MEQNDEYIILDKKKAKPYTRAKDATFDADAFKKWLSEGIWQMVKKERKTMGKIVNTDDIMTALCQHCDSHIEMCEECGMREIIESVPSAWISVKDRLPEESGRYLVCDVPYMIMSVVEYSARWRRFNCYDTFTAEYVNQQRDYGVTHWMPLPDAPEVEE